MKQLGYLLDSNILIYLLGEEEELIDRISLYKDYEWAMSIISHFELLNGARKQNMDFETMAEFLEEFQVLPFDEEISLAAVRLGEKKKTKRNLKFKDLIIAATAQQYGLTLITADRDFKTFEKDLNLIFL